MADPTAGPGLTRATLESNPAPGRGENLFVYLTFRDQVKDRHNVQVPMNTKDRYQALVDICHGGRPVTYQDAGGAMTVLLDDYDLLIDKATKTFFDGTFAAKLRRPRRRVT